MRIITFKCPESVVQAIDYLVRIGKYGSRSDFIREAIREKLAKELENIDFSYMRVYKRRDPRIKVIEIDV